MCSSKQGYFQYKLTIELSIIELWLYIGAKTFGTLSDSVRL